MVTPVSFLILRYHEACCCYLSASSKAVLPSCFACTAEVSSLASIYYSQSQLIFCMLQGCTAIISKYLRLISFPDGALGFLPCLRTQMNSSAGIAVLAHPSLLHAASGKGPPRVAACVRVISCQLLMSAGLVDASEPVTKAAVSLMHLMACHMASLASWRCCTHTNLAALLLGRLLQDSMLQ